MKQEVNLKEVILCSIVVTILFVIAFNFLTPVIQKTGYIISSKLERASSKQYIAPSRLFINVWRTAKNSYVDASMNSQDWNKWKYRYSNTIKTDEDAKLAIDSMLISLNDPYTKFLNTKLFKKEKIVLDSKITGIGITFKIFNDDILVNYILEGSPAEGQDILPGDIIKAVNGKIVSAQDFNFISNYIEGSSKNTIELTLMRNNNIFTKVLKKKVISIRTMDYIITHDNIAIVTLLNIMGDDAINKFKDILFKTNDAKALIIDLRNNSGGIISNAIIMANYMIDKNEIIRIKSRGNNKYGKLYSEGKKVFKKKPIIILINKKTASAAEIFAGVLRIYASAILIGENSFGKNSIQHVIPLNNESGLIITTDKYILPDGSDIYKKGLSPDIFIKQKNKNDDYQKDFALNLLRNIFRNSIKENYTNVST